MNSLPPATFASLLRRYRQAAGLTQEELAERAHLSVQAVGALERGDRRAPRKETIDLLVEALSLPEPERAVFEAIARQRRQADQATHEDVISADATPPALVDKDVVVTKNVRQQYPLWSFPHPKTEREASGRSRSKLVGSIVSVLMVALLGSALLVKGTLDRRPPLLCGGTLALATHFPTSVIEGSIAENAVNLAVRQNQNLGSGYTLKAINYNDVGVDDPSTSAENVRQMVNNPCILGIIGPFKSKGAPNEMPIAASAGLIMISPTNTNPALTLRPYAQAQDMNFDQLHPPGKPISYFSISPNDAMQAVADADLAFNLGAKSVYLVNNPSEYGELLISSFIQAFEKKGGKIIGSDVLGLDPSVIPDIAARIAVAKPDAVFYGGLVDSGAGLLKAQLVKLGYKGPFVSGDGIANNPDFVTQAGNSAANGTFASIAGQDPSTFTSGAAAQFIRDYTARYPGQAPSFSAYAYDAAMVLITAIKNLIVAEQAVTRAAIIGQVQHIRYSGVTGPISFDTNGDITHGVFSVYAVQNSKWAYAWQISV